MHRLHTTPANNDMSIGEICAMVTEREITPASHLNPHLMFAGVFVYINMLSSPFMLEIKQMNADLYHLSNRSYIPIFDYGLHRIPDHDIGLTYSSYTVGTCS